MRLVLLVRRLQPNVGRYTTGVWTRQYLEQQLRLVLAGRAAEELVYGKEELSSLHQLKLMMARQVRGTSVEQDCNNNMQHSCELSAMPASIPLTFWSLVAFAMGC